MEGWAFQISNTKSFFPQLLVTSDWKVIAKTGSGNVKRPDVESSFPCYGFDSPVGFSVFLDDSVLGSRGPSGVQVFVINPNTKTVSPLIKRFKQGLQMELTGRCNLRCPMCPSVIYSDFHKKKLVESDIPGFISFLQDRDFICLDGFGESLISPVFGDLLDGLPRGAEVVFHTNGLLLDKRTDVILKNSPPVNWIAISLDSLDPDKYSRLRPGGDLEKVLNNIRLFKKDVLNLVSFTRG